MITKPMLAETAESFESLKYPLAATPKLDGIRCVLVNGKALSRKFKPIPNDHIRTLIEAFCPDQFDGEIIIHGLPLNEISSAVMSRDGKPNFEYHVFDFVHPIMGLGESYGSRMYRLAHHYKGRPQPEFIKLVMPVEIDSPEALRVFEEQCAQLGYEGVMVRAPNGRYKCGRSTLKEGLLLKIKRWQDAEAVIIGFEEEMENTNEQVRNELGLAKRSTHKEGMKPAGMLGAFIVRDPVTGVEFRCGSGLDTVNSKAYWETRDQLLGKLLTYKFIPYGVKEKPKNPIFKSIRHPDDV